MLNYEYPPLGGGAGVIAKHIAEGLQAAGNEVCVITTWFEGEEENYVENGVRIVRLKSKRKLVWQSNPKEMMSWMKHAKKYLREHLQKEKYDLCFSHFALPGGEVAYSMYLEFNLPYVVMSHGHDIPWFFPQQMWFYHMLTYSWIRKIVSNSLALFVQSDDMERNARLFLGPKEENKVCQIPNGWDAEFFRPNYALKSKDFTIVFPGRLVKQKDPFTLLKACEIICREIPEIKIRVVGDGPLREKMESFVKSAGFQNNVEFNGWVDKDEMRLAYQSASLVVLPSLNEGMSMATLEAMACGTYVIVTDVSRNAKLIDKGVNGNLVPMSDVDALKQCVMDFYNNKFKKGYSVPEECLDDLKSIYSWDNVVDKYCKALEKII
jgi:glycosyltransferase involved in cell wall biosynthesis